MAFTPLNALNAFIAVARRRSFAAAARDLGIVAKRIAVLEDRIALKELVDTFSTLADRKQTDEQTLLFTEDAVVETITDGKVAGSLRGRAEIG